MTPTIHPIEVVGITDGGAASLPGPMIALITRADVLCGGARHLDFFPACPARRISIRGDMHALANILRAEVDASNRVVVLASGDPLLYGIGATLRRLLPLSLLRIHPNVSAVQLAWARIAEPWHDAAVVSAHGRALAPVIAAAHRHRKLAILTDNRHTPAVIAEALRSAGLTDNRRAVVCERLGGDAERITETTLTALCAQTFDPLNVLLLIADALPNGDVPNNAVTHWWPGAPDHAFAHKKPQEGLITKREVRVISLAALGLYCPDAVVWDIGAGSGSVAIEAARLVPTARVFAIERDAQSVALIQENCTAFGTSNVVVVPGVAPAVCSPLPDPHAVFIGGSGGMLATIVRMVTERMLPGGHLVMNLATLENLQTALATLHEAGWAVELLQLSVARGKAIGTMTRLQALNPVFVLSARRGVL